MIELANHHMIMTVHSALAGNFRRVQFSRMRYVLAIQDNNIIKNPQFLYKKNCGFRELMQPRFAPAGVSSLVKIYTRAIIIRLSTCA